MASRLTPELRDALSQQPAGQPLQVVDDQTQRVYFLVDQETARDFAVATLRRELQGAFDESERGESEAWDAAEIKAAGRARLDERRRTS